MRSAVAAVSSTSPPAAAPDTRAARFTVAPNQSPSRSTAAPACTPTLTLGKPWRRPTSWTIAIPSRTARSGSSARIISASPIVFTCSAP